MSFEASTLLIENVDDRDCRHYCNHSVSSISFKYISSIRVGNGGDLICGGTDRKCVQVHSVTKSNNKIVSNYQGWSDAGPSIFGTSDKDQGDRLSKAMARLLALVEQRYEVEQQQKSANDPFK